LDTNLSIVQTAAAADPEIFCGSASVVRAGPPIPTEPFANGGPSENLRKICGGPLRASVKMM
jgi:hypothetical protein